jgi:hypothetical protein
VEKPERKKLIGKPRYTWEDNIKIEFGEMGWGDMGWIQVVQDRDQ